MSLANHLANHQSLVAPGLPTLNRLESAINRIVSRWPDVVAAPASDRETIVRKMQKRIASNRWQGATLAEVVRAARVIFEPEFRGRIALTKVRSFFRREIRVSTNSAFLSAMASIYLATYQPKRSHSVRLARALNQSKDRLGRHWPKVLGHFPDLFEPGRPEHSIATAMLAMPDPWSGLQTLGFKNPHSDGLLRYAHLAFVRLCAPRLGTDEAVQHLLAWLRPAGREPMMAGAAPAIKALLDPWRRSNPNEELQERLIEGLLARYGDPRVRGIRVWDEVGEDHRNVMLRWLTGASIQFFLDVVTAVETSHMWEPRRKFWWSLYERGEITAAWVAFSPAAAERASSLNDQNSAATHLEFGKQVVGGGRRDTSLLILRTRKKSHIVVEGSHNYKVHIFADSHPQAPKLFEPAYDCEQIRFAQNVIAIPHYSGWEWRVSSVIL